MICCFRGKPGIDIDPFEDNSCSCCAIVIASPIFHKFDTSEANVNVRGSEDVTVNVGIGVFATLVTTIEFPVESNSSVGRPCCVNNPFVTFTIVIEFDVLLLMIPLVCL
jgi:hypothetical protein